MQKYDEELEETWDSDYTTNGDNMSCFWNDADEKLKSRERENTRIKMAADVGRMGV